MFCFNLKARPLSSRPSSSRLRRDAAAIGRTAALPIASNRRPDRDRRPVAVPGEMTATRHGPLWDGTTDGQRRAGRDARRDVRNADTVASSAV